ncbi:MAG: DUF2202 domain-containing protein [Proteobacteria bacterium]|nr:MAG: DUF2202 domain-containing protein [Pseudomonadota bacterium]
MQNPDALGLVSKKVILDANSFPVLWQVLRIAIYDEYRAYEFYKAVMNAHGVSEPFSNIMQAEIRHYETLIKLAQKHEIEPPINDLEGSITPPNTLQEAYELGVAYEIENIQMYDYLISYVRDYPDIVDVFYRLQAASFNNHLPAFRSHVSNSGLNSQELMEKFNEVSQTAQKVIAGEVGPSELTKLLNNISFSLLGGLLAGGVGGLAINEILNNIKKEEKDEEE